MSSPLVATTSTQLPVLHGKRRARNRAFWYSKKRLFCPCKFDTILALGEALLSSGRLCRKSGTCYPGATEKQDLADAVAAGDGIDGGGGVGGGVRAAVASCPRRRRGAGRAA